MAAMGQQRPPWLVGLLALASSNTITTHNIDDDMPECPMANAWNGTTSCTLPIMWQE
jgi:hypothetical protein